MPHCKALSPEFARIARVPTEILDDPIPLQLGTARSKSVINHGAYASMTLGKLHIPSHYFDIINLDRYDATIGTVALRVAHNIVLDPANDTIFVNEKRVAALTEG